MTAPSDRSASEALLAQALGLKNGERPFPWQTRLLDEFIAGKPPAALDIPTGLGKTAVIAIWLIARANSAQLPRRLVYVVDRRAVVDQATEVAESLAGNTDLLNKLGIGKLPISTLRGQHADNREWLADPTHPAIIVGTVDMIGSRLLFEGYGVSRKMRPYQAGLLGVDTLLVLDEAHLVPPFEKLLRDIARDSKLQPAPDAGHTIPPFQLLSLSATGRTDGCAVFQLTPADREPGTITRKRLDATKQLSIVEAASLLKDALTDEVWKLSGEGAHPGRFIVFCNEREVAKAVSENLEKKKAATELFVGGRRVHEREQAAARLKELGYIAGSAASPEKSIFLIATSAAEVGVDLDADHMVCDLVAWERMVQRLGRVNRRGEREDTRIIVVKGPQPEKAEQQAAHSAWFEAIQQLPPLPDGSLNASPGAIARLKEDETVREILEKATTPEPLRPAISRALADAWSMTSLEQHTGRPKIAPWLRGWTDDEKDAQTAVIWRKWLPQSDERKFFEAAPPHLAETLETETYRVVEWLMARAKAAATLKDRVAITLDTAGEVSTPWTHSALHSDDSNKRTRIKEQLFRALNRATLVVHADLAGLSTAGLLDDKHDTPPETAEHGGDPWSAVPFRVTLEKDDEANEADTPDPDWLEIYRIPSNQNEDGDPTESLVVHKRKQTPTNEDARATSRREQLLVDHQNLARDRAATIADRLGLPEPYAEMLEAAAALHDEGKRSTRWQRAFRAPAGDTYAKTRGPINQTLLAGYRHELASMRTAATHETIASLPPDLQDLALHLIAAHHGGARPIIGTNGFDDLPPSALTGLAQEVALRYVRLQRQWGPWGLAWWESLLRAADQQASRDLEENS